MPEDTFIDMAEYLFQDEKLIYWNWTVKCEIELNVSLSIGDCCKFSSFGILNCIFSAWQPWLYLNC